MRTSINITALSLMVMLFGIFIFQIPVTAAMNYTIGTGLLPGYYYPYGEPNSFQYDPAVGPAYLYKFKDGYWELYAMPTLPPTFMDSLDHVNTYNIHQVRNGKLTMRLRYSDGVYGSGYDNFMIDTNMDGDLLQPKLLNLEYKNGAPHRLANNNLVVRSETGRYHIYNPDGSSEVIKLDFSYGNKLELPAYDEFLSSVLYNPMFDDDFYTYVGVGLEYLPQTEQYVLLYCLSPLYGTDGSEEAYWQKNSPDYSTPLNVAVFDRDGNRQASFMLPDISVYGSIYADEHVKVHTGDGIIFQSTIEHPIFLSDQTSKILVEVNSIMGSESKYALIDLEHQETSAATEQDIKLFFPTYQDEGYNSYKSHNLAITLPTPYQIEYRSDGTYLLLSDGTKVLRYFQGPYLLTYLTKDTDGTYYAFFACDLEDKNHPANK